MVHQEAFIFTAFTVVLNFTANENQENLFYLSCLAQMVSHVTVHIPRLDSLNRKYCEVTLKT